MTRTKAALTAALFELLGEKDFSKISITELTRRADVDRKTFYLHYQTVDEILEEFYEGALHTLRETIEREGIFRAESVDMVALFKILCDLTEKDMPLFRRLAQGGGYTYYMERIRALLRGGMEDFYRRLSGGEGRYVTVEDGSRVIRLIQAIRTSSELGRSVTWEEIV